MTSKTPNNILGIDTSQPETVIGLNGRVISWVSKRNQSKELLPKIDKLLKTQKVAKDKIRGVVVNLGPGSFTGLRVGVTVANGFGYGLKIPVRGINEFDVIKQAYPKINVIVLDAKRGELFIRTKSDKPKLIPVAKLSREIKVGDSIYIDDHNLIGYIHGQLKRAGTIYIPSVSRKQKMQLMLQWAKLPKKFSQIFPLYIRGANITFRARGPFSEPEVRAGGNAKK